MTRTQHSTVVGVFSDRRQAQRAVEDLKREGVRDDQSGVVTRDENQATGSKATAKSKEGSHIEEGAVAGVLTGAAVGGLWAVGIAAGMLPAIGPVIAGGIFASILAS